MTQKEKAAAYDRLVNDTRRILCGRLKYMNENLDEMEAAIGKFKNWESMYHDDFNANASVAAVCMLLLDIPLPAGWFSVTLADPADFEVAETRA